MATAGETTARSRMEQSFAVGGALLQLVRRGRVKAVALGEVVSRIGVEHES
jgi:hypothetical protein